MGALGHGDLGQADVLLAALAAERHGVVTRRGLLAHGFSGRQVAVRIERAQLHPLYRGVYAVGHRGLTVTAAGSRQRARQAPKARFATSPPLRCTGSARVLRPAGTSCSPAVTRGRRSPASARTSPRR